MATLTARPTHAVLTFATHSAQGGYAGVEVKTAAIADADDEVRRRIDRDEDEASAFRIWLAASADIGAVWAVTDDRGDEVASVVLV
jgi:uncharacterized protein (DUF736 family)